MSNIRIYFFLSSLLVARATVNICIPLHSSSAEVSTPDDLFKEIKDEIVAKTSNKSNLHLEHLDVDVSHPAISLYGTMDDLDLYHFHEFDICFLENLFLNLSYYQFDVFNLTFRNLRVEGKYNLTGDIGDLFDIYGVGDFWMELRNFSIAMTNFSINVTDEICIPVNIDINLQEVRNQFDNFMEDPDLEILLNGTMMNILPESFSIFWAEMKAIFDKPLEDEINNIIHHNVPAILHALRSAQNVKAAPYCYSTYK
ncbi:hypothetical protein TcasGA2_TC032224 [Tribolium castaneum]|uniref:Uncharacterized protein n=1 Tax=Tribolium castaneum TaxID=7070 RepID=A0A139WND9_TRICA|nr:PREDICTED: uncharacterized protein LOC103312147 [Tribolium castaneum]KYB29377.1 hypothetical protein TcasGA2_TC032224 [Tribolium castaneum]|eukprot:XP_008190268.1 PREDICTED: uncharacterized protein LOC103312147 [Tribolium castaneum]